MGSISHPPTSSELLDHSLGHTAPHLVKTLDSALHRLAVLETAALSDKELGAYLRRKGLHEGTLKQWRALVNNALGKPQAKAKKSREHKEADKRVRKLERELRRKDAALAETAALLVLKKKAQAIWGDEDDDTDPKSGR